MIVTRTPYRISLMGGGSDYPRYFHRHGGAVVTTTIDKYCYLMVNRLTPFLGFKYGVLWAPGMQTANEISEIQHPSVRGCLEYLGVNDGIEVRHGGEMPARSGLGSSSAFTVGMLNALHALEGVHSGRALLATEAIQVEQEVLNETVGIQDQIACAWGGCNMIEFDRDGRYKVNPLHWKHSAYDEIESHLMLVYTDVQRFASEIAGAQVDNVDRKQRELAEIVSLVPDTARAMERGDAKMLGKLLHEGWMLKRELSDKVSNPPLDELYETGLKHGAYGGKVLGAGGGGFVLFCAPPYRHRKIANAMNKHWLPVKFEHRGSYVVLREI